MNTPRTGESMREYENRRLSARRQKMVYSVAVQVAVGADGLILDVSAGPGSLTDSDVLLQSQLIAALAGEAAAAAAPHSSVNLADLPTELLVRRKGSIPIPDNIEQLQRALDGMRDDAGRGRVGEARPRKRGRPPLHARRVIREESRSWWAGERERRVEMERVGAAALDGEGGSGGGSLGGDFGTGRGRGRGVGRGGSGGIGRSEFVEGEFEGNDVADKGGSAGRSGGGGGGAGSGGGDGGGKRLTILERLGRESMLPGDQLQYNQGVERAVAVARNAVRRLRSRWKLLSKRAETKVEELPEIVGACCVLHNLCEKRGERYDVAWEEGVGNEEEDADEAAKSAAELAEEEEVRRASKRARMGGDRGGGQAEAAVGPGERSRLRVVEEMGRRKCGGTVSPLPHALFVAQPRHCYVRISARLSVSPRSLPPPDLPLPPASLSPLPPQRASHPVPEESCVELLEVLPDGALSSVRPLLPRLQYVGRDMLAVLSDLDKLSIPCLLPMPPTHASYPCLLPMPPTHALPPRRAQYAGRDMLAVLSDSGKLSILAFDPDLNRFVALRHVALSDRPRPLQSFAPRELGRLLAVHPLGRAVAVAAMEGRVAVLPVLHSHTCDRLIAKVGRAWQGTQ
ncbi:unnamed protein product [Closterium sp. NIES-65]|nr:unnamed protein product [Closterium sp. NIES-65]